MKNKKELRKKSIIQRILGLNSNRKKQQDMGYTEGFVGQKKPKKKRD